MIANYHTHTPRCHHATGDEREYIENAVAAGMKILGFSDHSPQFFDGGHVSGIRMTPKEAEGYVSKLRALADEYRDEITVKIGFEAEYFPAIFPRLQRFCRDYGVDYLIMGQHCLIDEAADFWVGAPRADRKSLTFYTDQVIEGLSTGSFTYMAHPDMYHYTGDEDWFRHETERLCRFAKKASIPLEVNMLGFGDHRHYPTERFFRAAGEIGCDLIVGCDAHRPEVLLDRTMQEETVTFAARFGTVLETLPLRPV